MATAPAYGTVWTEQRATRNLIWGLIALSVLLSSAVCTLTTMGQRLARNISDAVAQLDAVTEDVTSVNEVTNLRTGLMRCRLICSNRKTLWIGVKSTIARAILRISLSTFRYLETLDESPASVASSTVWHLAAPVFTG